MGLVLSKVYLDPGDRLLGLHHPGGLGGLALAHQLGGAKVAGTEENSFYQNFGISDGTWRREKKVRMLPVSSEENTLS